MHDPQTQICSFPSYKAQCWMEKKWWIPSWLMRFIPLFTLWHVDPFKRNGKPVRGDDSCGWFMRSGHGDQAKLEKIKKRFAEDWDRIFKSESGNVYFCGLFCPNGDPHFSVSGIVLNLFFTAANVHFEVNGSSNWKKSRAWMQANLFDIMMFAENPSDSLFDGITRKFEAGCGEAHTPRIREERIERMASCIYGWILREQRPWYRHPRWHVHHWKIQLHIWQYLKRGLFDRCSKCGKGFKFGASVCGSWHGKQIWHDACSGSNTPSKS